MKTIQSTVEASLEIKKSLFITCLYKVYTKEEMDRALLEVKEEYKDATHYCYACVMDQFQKTSDDGEPGGTAGVPILEVLKKQDLNYLLAVVVRYFGGIKLGSGGLVRAYSKSIQEALKKCSFRSLVDGYLIELEVNYSELKQLEYILREEVILSKDFQETIHCTIMIAKSDMDKIKSYHYQILEEIKIEK